MRSWLGLCGPLGLTTRSPAPVVAERTDLASIVSENGPPSSDGPITEGAMACDPIDADELATVDVQTAVGSPPPS